MVSLISVFSKTILENKFQKQEPKRPLSLPAKKYIFTWKIGFSQWRSYIAPHQFQSAHVLDQHMSEENAVAISATKWKQKEKYYLQLFI